MVLDHLVIGANHLEEGLAYVKEKLGIDMPPGGNHPKMSTHNHLLKIGEGIFLEVIAIDPQAPSLPYPRWFSLDDPGQIARLKERPRLITWVVGTPDLHKTVSDSELDLGKAREMTRGNLRWEIAFREDGSMAENGLLPIFIQWPKGMHPANNMTDLGLRLERLTLIHPEPDKLKSQMESLSIHHLADIRRVGDAWDYGLEAVFKKGADLLKIS